MRRSLPLPRHATPLPARHKHRLCIFRSHHHHHQLFDQIGHPNPSSIWPENAAAIHPFQALRYRLRSEVALDPATVIASLKQCRGRAGFQVHAVAVSSGLDAYTVVSNSLMSMYSKSGSLDLAWKVFGGMPCPDVVSWNTILAGFASGAEALEFVARMRRVGVPPDPVTFTTVLASLTDLQDLESVQQLHCLVLKSRFDSDVFVGNALIAAYTRTASVDDAKKVFDEMAVRDLVSWNSLICGLTQDGSCGTEAINLFLRMVREECIRPDRISLASLISACGHAGSIGFGLQVHGFGMKIGVEFHVSVSNVLMSMYYKYEDVDSAKKVFEKMIERNVISWTTMISIDPGNAIYLFNSMRHDGVQPNDVTFVALLFAVHDDMGREGQMIHGISLKTGIAEEMNVCNCLITMYAKLKSTEDARKVFDGMHSREIVSWNALVAGYAQNEQCEEALEVFSSLIFHCNPNQYTYASVLSAMTGAQTVSLTYGQSCHCRIIKSGLNTDAYVSGALIDLYAKRGSIADSQRAFDETSLKSLIGWTAIISAHAKHGNYEEVMDLFDGMKRAGVRPDHITFLAVLVACGGRGMVDAGCQVFDSMVRELEIEPWPEHYACVVDMLGKAGRLNEAEEFLHRAPTSPGVSALQSLLGACRMHGNAEMASKVAAALVEMEPAESGAYVLMSNIYAEKGDWENVAKMRRGMRERGVRKEIGFSWVDAGIGDSIYMHKFSSGDKTHPLAEEIHAMAWSLGVEISVKEESYSVLLGL
ncbi:hypothetical protein Cni_G02630 [Canna indica]|uniref:Pentatricopeptide repeat-containing protein n=1 Tax=Canna indica TaxID=4628 RepID=A0AAQ3JRQ5_9LILI|nr:hypothetical protein Cni_G02630 [Canna indica]